MQKRQTQNSIPIHNENAQEVVIERNSLNFIKTCTKTFTVNITLSSGKLNTLSLEPQSKAKLFNIHSQYVLHSAIRQGREMKGKQSRKEEIKTVLICRLHKGTCRKSQGIYQTQTKQSQRRKPKPQTKHMHKLLE
jgi:hypothetical protein